MSEKSKLNLKLYERLRKERDVFRNEVIDLRHRNAALVLQLARKQADEGIPIEAKSEAGITTGIVAVVGLLATLLRGRDMSHPHVRAALAGLGSDDDAGNLFNSAIGAAYDAEIDL